MTGGHRPDAEAIGVRSGRAAVAGVRAGEMQRRAPARRPGQVFEREDPLVAGNMKMLEATEQEGMVYGTGWDATGIWNYFASFYGHAWLWLGETLTPLQLAGASLAIVGVVLARRYTYALSNRK